MHALCLVTILHIANEVTSGVPTFASDVLNNNPPWLQTERFHSETKAAWLFFVNTFKRMASMTVVGTKVKMVWHGQHIRPVKVSWMPADTIVLLEPYNLIMKAEGDNPAIAQDLLHTAKEWKLYRYQLNSNHLFCLTREYPDVEPPVIYKRPRTKKVVEDEKKPPESEASSSTGKASSKRKAASGQKSAQVIAAADSMNTATLMLDPAHLIVDHNLRVAKLLGGGLHNSCVVCGMVLKTNAVGSIKRMEKAEVVVFAGDVNTTATETKGTVLIHSAELLENYAMTEEAKVKELIKAVAESGARVIVSGGSLGEMALHFCERYKKMVLKIISKFELRRFCRTTGAVAHLKLSRPSSDDLAYVDSISVEDIGGVTVTIVRNEQDGNSISAVVLRGSTDSALDYLERAVDDGVNTYKAMCRDCGIVLGAAATEIQLSPWLDKYAISKYAESFEFVPKTLAMEIIASLYTGHGPGNIKLGIDLEEGAGKDVSETKVCDLFATKLFVLKYASGVACTVLRVDQVDQGRDAAAATGAGVEED